jgi:hypothetical protein
MFSRVNQHTEEGKINQEISAAEKRPKWGAGAKRGKEGGAAAGKVLMPP